MAARPRDNWQFRDAASSIALLLQNAQDKAALLAVGAIAALIVDPFLSERIRQLLCVSLISAQWYEQTSSFVTSFWTFFKVAFFYGILIEVIKRRYGTLWAIAIAWIQSEMLPPVILWFRGECSDELAVGNFNSAAIPFAAYLVTILSWIWRWEILRFWMSATLWAVLVFLAGTFWFWGQRSPHTLSTFVGRYLVRYTLLALSYVYSALECIAFFPIKFYQGFETEIVKHRDRTILASDLFAYTALPMEPRIRLLKVLKKIPFSGVRCELVEVDPNEAPPYEAVSYCWGTAAPSKAVIVDGRPMKVLDAIFDVIQYRHSYFEDKFLWIDSVCIDQTNGHEKSLQIPLMGIIFARARRVLAWLGPFENAYKARGMIFSLLSKRHQLQQSTEAMLAEFNRHGDSSWREIALLLCNPWFSRSWIVQEVALARELLMVFGTVTMDWSGFAEALQIIGDPLLIRFLGDAKGEIPVMQPIMGLKSATLIALYRNRRINGDRIQLDELLEAGMAMQSTKEHDKIYAFLGLANGEMMRDPALLPRYDRPVEEVFTDVMKLFVRSEEQLDALHLAGSSLRENTKLPSWVPDFTNSYVRVWQMGKVPMFSAGLGFRPIVKFVEHSSPCIEVAANIVDEILTFTDLVPLGVENGLDEVSRDPIKLHQDLRDWFIETLTLARLFSANPYPHGGAEQMSLEEALWRVIVAYGVQKQGPSKEEFRVQFLAFLWCLGLSEDAPDPPPYQRLSEPHRQEFTSDEYMEKFALTQTFVYYLGGGSMGRRIAVTKGGYLCVVPPGVKVGDIAVLIWGTQTPYLVRKRDEKIADLSTWELVGCCYILGLMEGEGCHAAGHMFMLV